MKFTILGPPRTKKNHARIVLNKASGRRMVIPSKQACDWTKTAVLQLKAQWRGWTGGDGPVELPVNCRALIYRDRATGDVVNYYQAIADALEDAGVVENDRLIVSWDGSRMLVDRERPRVEIELTPVTP